MAFRPNGSGGGRGGAKPPGGRGPGASTRGPAKAGGARGDLAARTPREGPARSGPVRDFGSKRPPRPKEEPRKAPKAKIETAREDGLHRIAKLLARAGVASRREIERMIEDKRIKLDGELVATPATLLADLAGVTVDDKPVAAPEPTRLFLFHKPTGVLTAERDFSGRPTLYSILPEGLPRLVPVGRLDLNTEGLLLLTNDGQLKRALELPSSGIERTYRARTFGDVTQAQLEELAEGIEVDGIRYGRIDANLERSTGRNVWIELTLTEGKNREVRRVLEHLGLQVSRLIRTRYGSFVLGNAPAKAIEEVSGADIVKLRRGLNLDKAAPDGD